MSLLPDLPTSPYAELNPAHRWFPAAEVRAIGNNDEQELDLPQKMALLRRWCADTTAADKNGHGFNFDFVDEVSWKTHAPVELQEYHH